MRKNAGVLDPAQMTALLRAGVLAVEPLSVGMAVENLPPVWGVMIEFGHPEVIASLVVLADGSVSIYMSDGNGIIGCGLHADVRVAAIKMLNSAQHVQSSCIPMQQHPSPQPDGVTFYLLTRQGVMGTEVLRSDLDEGAVPLAELYYAAHGVIDLVELLGAGTELVNEMRMIKTQLGRDADAVPTTVKNELSADEQYLVRREQPTRGRACRILPYVGNVARRSQS
jgi:hypothetical protein